MSLKATYFGANGWLLEFDKTRVLLDPWLIGELTFPPFKWLLKGKHRVTWEIPKDINLILLTQGLADHCHPETLTHLPKRTQVVCSSAAAGVVNKLGFEKVVVAHPGEAKSILDLKIIASAGAKVPNIENGYILIHESGSIYIEPHGFLDTDITPQHIDILITPVIEIGLPIIGPFIKGREVINKLVNLFTPNIIFSSTTGGDIVFKGLLNSLLYQKGNSAEVSKVLDPEIVFIDPIPGESYSINRNLVDN